MSHPDFPIKTPAAARHKAHFDIDETLISTVVETFYEKIRQDDQLGPIFNNRIEDRWSEHLAKMKDFWSSVLLTSGRYKGRPMQVHAQMGDLRPGDFSRWLVLFRANAHQVCPEDIAEVFIERAEKIAESLQLGLFYQHRPAPGNTFKRGEILKE